MVFKKTIPFCPHPARDLNWALSVWAEGANHYTTGLNTFSISSCHTKLYLQYSHLILLTAVISWLNKQLNEIETAGAITKRAPLTEAYLTSHRPATSSIKSLGSQFASGSQPGVVLHSTPLSTAPLPQGLGIGGSAGSTHTTLVCCAYVFVFSTGLSQLMKWQWNFEYF